MQPVFYLVPHCRAAERFFDDAVEHRLGAHAERAGAVCNVIVNAHCEGIGALENHTYVLSEPGKVGLFGVDIGSAYQNFAGNFATFNEVVHTVQRFDERGLTATRRAYHCRELVYGKFHIDVFKRVERSVIQVHIFDRYGNVALYVKIFNLFHFVPLLSLLTLLPGSFRPSEWLRLYPIRLSAKNLRRPFQRLPPPAYFC